VQGSRPFNADPAVDEYLVARIARELEGRHVRTWPSSCQANRFPENSRRPLEGLAKRLAHSHGHGLIARPVDLEPSPAVDHLPVELRVLPTRNPDCRPGVGIDDPVRTAGMRHLFRANIDGPGACHVSVEAEQVQAIAGARIVVTFPACRV